LSVYLAHAALAADVGVCSGNCLPQISNTWLATERARCKSLSSSRALSPAFWLMTGTTPVGWIAVEQRVEYPRLARSRVLKPVDEAEVWSVTCFFIARSYRRKGVTVELLGEAIKFVTKNGGKIVEGYPVEPKGDNVPAPFVYTGLPGAFLKAGFKEVARFSPTRPIFRYVIQA
jgi:hypothetical protein